jgi:hypothetical protein
VHHHSQIFLLILLTGFGIGETGSIGEILGVILVMIGGFGAFVTGGLWITKTFF